MARHAGPVHTGYARRRFAAAVLAVVGIAGLGIASAAQLNLTTAPLGAGAQIVATCQSTGTITVSFPTTWSTPPPPAAAAYAYRVTSVKLEGVNINCANKAYRIQLLDAALAALGPEITGTTPLTIVDNTFTVTISANQQRAQDLGGVSIIIQG